MNRRTFLEVSSSLAAMPFFMGANNPHVTPKYKGEKAVVFVMLSGGISHIDFTHGNPDLPGNRRSINGEAQTKTPGLFMGADFAKLAGNSDKFNVVHNYKHNNGNHQNAVYWQMSGYANNKADQDGPAYGAYVSKLFGPSNPKNGLPVYLRTSRIDGDGGGWIGGAYGPFETSAEGTKDLVMNLGKDRFDQRLTMLDMLETKMNKEYSHSSLDNMTKLRQQAVSMIAGDLRKVFDVNQENAKIREAYGRSQAGDAMLLARRLLQNGGKYISVNIGGWDMHTNISQAMKNTAPRTDQALTAFINEMHEMGMNENVMLVVTGDFGRTPVINVNAGRDHWPSLVSLLISGGASEQGRLIGKADGNRERPDGDSFEPEDLSKTIFDHFGVQNVQLTDIESRPRWVYLEHAKNILV